VTHHELGERSHNREEESNERRAVETPSDLIETIRILMAQLQRCKDDNERLIKEQEQKTEINAVLIRASQIYKGSCNMDQKIFMWIHII